MFTYFRIFLPYIVLSLTVQASDKPGCTFHNATDRQKKADNQIEVLKGNRYHTVDDGIADGYTYYIGICTSADPSPEDTDLSTAGVLQYKKGGKQPPKILGQFSQSEIMAGTQWVMLQYNGGDENASAKIMFVCDPNSVNKVNATLLEEQGDKPGPGYYLFEISTHAVCIHQPFITVGLSVGSVLLIVFFSVAAVYVLAGFIYNRFVSGAKGREQFPNHTFWEDFGNLQADGCDLVCRSRRSREPRTYKGIGDDQLRDMDFEERTDENLLPM